MNIKLHRIASKIYEWLWNTIFQEFPHLAFKIRLESDSTQPFLLCNEFKIIEGNSLSTQEIVDYPSVKWII